MILSGEILKRNRFEDQIRNLYVFQTVSTNTQLSLTRITKNQRIQTRDPVGEGTDLFC